MTQIRGFYADDADNADKNNMTDQKNKIEDDVEDIGHTTDEVKSPKSEVNKHGIFHKHCKDCEKNKQEALEFKSGWQRAQADYQNLKKESENMRGEWVRMSEQQIVEDFLPVYDNFNKAFAVKTLHATSLHDENWAKGIEYIMKQYWKVLQDHGVEQIKTVGEMFDTSLHEAVGEEDGEVEGKILKEIEAGYVMKGKVIKVAKVIISKI